MEKGWVIFLGIYVFINTLIALYTYFKLKKFYDQKLVMETKENGEQEVVDLHQKYHVFRKTDKLSFLRLLIGVNLLFWPKLILMIIVITLLIWVLA
jgi:hypothetical protein